MNSGFSHLNPSNQPSMVDVSHKQITAREAHAQTIVLFPPEVYSHFQESDIESPKGPVIHTAILAGTMAVKKTAEIIPLCHPLPLQGIKINIELEGNKATIHCMVKCEGKTGVEMEALTGASVAALTLYDMCKCFSHEIIIQETKLIRKSGGKSDLDLRH